VTRIRALIPAPTQWRTQSRERYRTTLATQTALSRAHTHTHTQHTNQAQHNKMIDSRGRLIYLCKDFSCADGADFFHSFSLGRDAKTGSALGAFAVCRQTKTRRRSHSSLFSTPKKQSCRGRRREYQGGGRIFILYATFRSLGSIKCRNSLPTDEREQQLRSCCMQIIRRLAFNPTVINVCRERMAPDRPPTHSVLRVFCPLA
jgi:hypothetical protein